MEIASSFEESRICTSPVTGSSISPVSVANFDCKLASTSAAAVSNYTITDTKTIIYIKK